MRILTIFLLLLIYCATPFADLSQLPDKASTDRSEYRHLVLDNGLRVILLSDPDLNKSSAGIAVGAGSYNDPEDRAGLAHFLEHMLFLGTEKYPDESEYSNYLRTNGGYSNAYTSGDHTNYHFEINHQAFEGALDRFSQFFIAPLFRADFTEREMNAVDSEFEKNLQSDLWRQQEVFRTLVREDHPEHHFSIGNLKTLTGIERDEFMAFYDRYYSANLMALSMTSSVGLDQMEAWVRQYFSPIKNLERPAVDYTAELVDTGRPPGVAMIEPVKDRRTLQMLFPVQGTREYYRSKPDGLISFLLGYEGEGSLLSYLKSQGLATTLGAGAYQETKDYSLFYISAELTPKGTENWQQVMQATFAYVRMLRDADYPEYLFQERATMARLNELYADKGEGAGRAVSLSRDALHYPLEDAERVAYIWEESSPELYFEILGAIRPENMIATLEAKGVPTHLTEEHFGVQYSIQAFEPELLTSLKAPAQLDALMLPAANKFIPSSVELIAQRPVKVIDEPGLTLFYAQDTDFERPRVSYQIRIRQPNSLGKLHSVVMRDFYVSVVNEMLNEQTYTAAVAGLAVNVGNSAKGIAVAVSGYSQSANGFLDHVISQMRKPELDKERFEALKERKLRELENAVFADAWRQAMELERKLFFENYFTPRERLSVARDVSLDEVRQFAKTLFKKGNVEMMAYGNVSQDEAVTVARRVVDTLTLKPVAERDIYDTRVLALTVGKPVIASNTLKVNNSAYRQAFLLGEATPENRAAAQVIGNFFAEPYYSEMRTRQQLGYIVAGFMNETEDRLYGRFIIQSADYSADELKRRSEAFLATLPTLFDAMPDEKLAAIVAGVRAELEKKDKSIAERGARYFGLAFEQEEHWSQSVDTLAALDRLGRDELRAMLQKIADQAGSKSFAVLSMAEQHADAAKAVEPSFTDVDAWKRKQRFE